MPHPSSPGVEGLQNLGAHLNRRLHPGRGADGDPARRIIDLIGKRRKVLQIRTASADEALRGINRILRILFRGFDGLPSRLHRPVGKVAHDGREKPPAFFISEHFGRSGNHGGDKRIRRSEVDPDGKAMLMGSGRKSGFGDLKECHDEIFG